MSIDRYISELDFNNSIFLEGIKPTTTFKPTYAFTESDTDGRSEQIDLGGGEKEFTNAKPELQMIGDIAVDIYRENNKAVLVVSYKDDNNYCIMKPHKAGVPGKTFTCKFESTSGILGKKLLPACLNFLPANILIGEDTSISFSGISVYERLISKFDIAGVSDQQFTCLLNCGSKPVVLPGEQKTPFSGASVPLDIDTFYPLDRIPASKHVDAFAYIKKLGPSFITDVDAAEVSGTDVLKITCKFLKYNGKYTGKVTSFTESDNEVYEEGFKDMLMAGALAIGAASCASDDEAPKSIVKPAIKQAPAITSVSQANKPLATRVDAIKPVVSSLPYDSSILGINAKYTKAIDNVVKYINDTPALKDYVIKAGGWSKISPAVIVTLVCEAGAECTEGERRNLWNIILNRATNNTAFKHVDTVTEVVLDGMNDSKANAFSFWGDADNSNWKIISNYDALRVAMTNDKFKKAFAHSIVLQLDKVDKLKGATMYQTHKSALTVNFSNKYYTASKVSTDKKHIYYKVTPVPKKTATPVKTSKLVVKPNVGKNKKGK